MAVALQSNSTYKIVSQDESQTGKSVFLVKLTDSCLKSLEQHKHQTAELSKSGSPSKPSIRFKANGKSGALFIPSKSGVDKDGTTFNFSGGSLFNKTSTVGLDCFQESKADMDLILLGNITEKITVSANNDSYEATRNRMAEAENKRKGNSAKVIDLKVDGAKKIKKNPYRRQQNTVRNLKSSGSRFGQSSSSSSKGLREKVIHLLALRPMKKPELRSKLDGVKLKDSSVLSGILQQVAVMQDNQYNLNRHLYTEIQVDTWPSYTDQERETIKNKLVSEMGTSVDRLSPGPLAAGLSTNSSSKRPLPRGANPAGKKPRIAHNSNTPKNDVKQTSPPRLTSRPASQSITQTKSNKEHHKSNHKLEKPSPNKSTSGNTENSRKNKNNNNDTNNNNCSFTDTESPTNEDYHVKYPEITSYAQRCSYKDDFTRGYREYNAIKERSDLVSQQFNELKERLKNFPEDSEKAKEVHAEIFKLYDEKKEEWTKDRQKMNILYPNLSHIKQRVIQYDQAHT